MADVTNKDPLNSHLTAHDIQEAFRQVQRELLAHPELGWALRWERMAVLLNDRVKPSVIDRSAKREHTMREESGVVTTISGLPAPDYWMCEEKRQDADGVYYRYWRRTQGEAISVIESIAPKPDGRQWLHVSVARANPAKFPTWEHLQLARKLFIGEHRECYLVFPTQERYVNFFDVLHLHCCLDQPQGVLPHMEGYVEGIGLSL